MGQRLSRILIITFVALVLAGFGVGFALDVGILPVTPVVLWLHHLPAVARVLIYVVVGVPVAIGVALYLPLELADMANFASSPFRWPGRNLRR
jgi:hypothetical protein